MWREHVTSVHLHICVMLQHLLKVCDVVSVSKQEASRFFHLWYAHMTIQTYIALFSTVKVSIFFPWYSTTIHTLTP